MSFKDQVNKNMAEMSEVEDISLTERTRSIPEILNKDLAEELFNQERITGYSTGYDELDNIIGGIRSQTLTILAGATGIGKSLFALNILCNLAKSGTKVCYFDLENGTAQSIERLVRIWFGLDKIFFGDYSNITKLKDMRKEIVNFSYYSHDDLSSMQFESLGYKLLLQLIENEVDKGVTIFLIDPLQALESSVSDSNSFNEQGTIVRAFKDSALKFGASTIICHHMRKSTSGGGEWVDDIDEVKTPKYRMPTIDDLRGSGKIGDYATDVWGITRMASSPTAEARAKTLLRILKNRSGSKEDVRLQFNEQTLIFTGKKIDRREPIEILNDGNLLPNL